MKIEFIIENEILLSTKYIKLLHEKSFDKIIIINNDINFSKLQCRDVFNKNLTIKTSYKNYNNSNFFNIHDILIKTNELVLIGVFDDSLNIYEQGYIDNFKLLTDKKGKINWYKLNENQKYFYLRGCYLLGGVKEYIDNINPFITIDLSKAKTDLDVFYEIGKSFFKSDGYFGTEINSFIDCLCNIDESMKKKEMMPVLQIKGHLNFKKYFGNNILYNDFYNEFNTSGFTVINID